MGKRLENKVALVTGGGSGIGRCSALTLAKEGAKVIIADVNIEGGEGTLRMIREAGGEALFICSDVSNASHVEELVARIIDTYGRLDCALNNAGISGTKLLTPDYSEEEWDRVIRTNLKGVWLCMKYEIPEMLKAGKGSIVNTSSAAGLKGFQYRSAYSASKHAVIGLTRTAALEYARMNIRINAICPGFIDVGFTERTFVSEPEFKEKFKRLIPMGRFGKGEEVAEAVVWLCSDAAAFITGHALVIDGGQAA
jgi:NAD(P)-dependent dehydrogenase (short-subunit alcohol dehydrogenase family)